MKMEEQKRKKTVLTLICPPFHAHSAKQYLIFIILLLLCVCVCARVRACVRVFFFFCLFVVFHQKRHIFWVAKCAWIGGYITAEHSFSEYDLGGVYPHGITSMPGGVIVAMQISVVVSLVCLDVSRALLIPFVECADNFVTGQTIWVGGSILPRKATKFVGLMLKVVLCQTFSEAK